MEVALTWLFGSVHHRVPSGRAPSFTHPLLPPPRAGQQPRPPPGVHACALPPHRARARPLAATVGHGVDDWANHSAFYITNSRGQRLFVQLWRPLPDTDADDDGDDDLSGLVATAAPRAPPRARFTAPWRWFRRRGRQRRRGPNRERGIVHLLHGLNDHSNKYASVARAWVDAGYVVAAHDSHGHGRSDGFRAHTASMAHYVEDARLAMDEAAARLPARMTGPGAPLPRLIVAHSLGGAVAIHVARDTPPPNLRGVLLTAPAVRVFPRPLLRLVAPVLATLAPLQPVQRLKFDRRRRDGAAAGATGQRGQPATQQQQQQQQRRDPLVVRSAVRARVGYEVLKSCDKIMSCAHEFTTPVFVGHSRGDRVTNARGSEEFVRRVGSADRTLRLYEGRAHDLLLAGAGGAGRRARRARWAWRSRGEEQAGKQGGGGAGGEVLADMVRWAEERTANGAGPSVGGAVARRADSL